MRCFKCGNYVEDNSIFCLSCGADLLDNNMPGKAASAASPEQPFENEVNAATDSIRKKSPYDPEKPENPFANGIPAELNKPEPVSKSDNNTKKRGSIKWLIIGLAIGIAVILLIFFFILPKINKNKSQEVSSPVSNTAETVQKTFSEGEYSYYYMMAVSSYQGTDLDPAVPLTDQTTTDDDGNEITLDEYFDRKAKESMRQVAYYLGLAEQAGITISDEDEAGINREISEIDAICAQNNISLSYYLSYLYGDDVTPEIFRSILEDKCIVEKYLSTLTDGLTDSITDEEIRKEADNNRNDFYVCAIRLFGFRNEYPDNDDGLDATMKLAEEMYEEITDEESFKTLAVKYADEENKEVYALDNSTNFPEISYLIAEQNSSEFAEWLFAEDRAEGDKMFFANSDSTYVYVVLVTKTAYLSEECNRNVRHILVTYDTVKAELEAETPVLTDDETEARTSEQSDDFQAVNIASDGTEIEFDMNYTPEVCVETYERAKDIYDIFMASPSEDYFAELAEQYSEDGGSIGDNGKGGLYENIAKTDNYIQEFLDWTFDEERQPGDCGIIKTAYGYHVMYYVSENEEPVWKINAKNSVANAKIVEQTVSVNEECENIELAFDFNEDAARAKIVKQIENKMLS